MIIYQTTNKINGKIYIGQQSCENNEYLGSGFKIKLAIKKYGAENFEKEILQVCSTQEDLNEAEKHWIKVALSQDPRIGYNVADGGLYCRLSEETKQKISKALIGKKLSEEHRRKISKAQSGEKNPMKGKHHSEETKQKLREINRGKKHSQETRTKMSKAHKKFSEETRQKMSESKKGCISWNEGKHHSIESKKKMSEARKQWWQRKRLGEV